MEDKKPFDKEHHFKHSTNYKFCNFFLPKVLFSHPALVYQAVLEFENDWNNHAKFDEFLTTVIKDMADYLDRDMFVSQLIPNQEYEPPFNLEDLVDVEKGMFRLISIPFSSDNKEVIGVVTSIPNPIVETECNFIAICFTKERFYYFESELYEGIFGDKDFFGLCGREGNRHISYSSSIKDIRSYEDMKAACLEIIGLKH